MIGDVTFLAVLVFFFWLELAIGVVAVGGALYALGHAILQRADAFTAVDKLTKPSWVAILAVSATLLFVTVVFFREGLGFNSNFLGWIAVIAVGIYLADVKPRVDDIQRGGRRW